MYDGNGSRVRQVPGSLTPSEGETRYSFNQAGQMVRVESHDGISYTVQVDIGYTGLGHRAQGITYLDGVPVTVTYTLDGMVGQPLVIANSADTTLILYGQYAIGEYKVQATAGEQWQYYLGDAELSVRQLTDSAGGVILARTYAPFGILLAQEGSGASLFGYAGGQAGVSDLWYFGSGYFDPQTGQFLAAEGNPFAPLVASILVNPGGLLFGPLMLWNWRRRKKGGKLPPTGLFVLALLFTVGLAGCGEASNMPTPIIEEAPEAPTLLPTSDPTQIPAATATRNPTSTARPNYTATIPVSTATCDDCISTPDPTTTSIPTVTNTPQPPLPPGVEIKTIYAGPYLQEFFRISSIAQRSFDIQVHSENYPSNPELYRYEIGTWILIQEQASFHPANYGEHPANEEYFALRGLYTSAILLQVVKSREQNYSPRKGIDDLFRWIQATPESGQFAYSPDNTRVNQGIYNDYLIIAYLVEYNKLPDFLETYPDTCTDENPSGRPIFYGHYGLVPDIGEFAHGRESLSVSARYWLQTDWVPSLKDFYEIVGYYEIDNYE